MKILMYLKKAFDKWLLYSDYGHTELLVSQMLIGRVHPLIDGLPHAIVFSLEKILCGVLIEYKVRISCNGNCDL